MFVGKTKPPVARPGRRGTGALTPRRRFADIPSRHPANNVSGTRTNMTQDASSALSQLAEAMQADGYILTVEQGPAELRLTVTATEDACAECLVPKAMFKTMAESVLADAGVAPAGGIVIVYPEAHHDS
jgi:hypothetical protein